MPALGEELRAARESRRLSLSDVSDQIHIRSLYLQAIEDENWGSIAAPVYVRGFVRTYARFLGLNPEEAVAQYNGAAPEVKPAAPKPALDLDRRGPSPWLLAAGAIAILLVGFVGFNYYQLQKSTQAAILAEGTPVPAAPAAPVTVPRSAPAPLSAFPSAAHVPVSSDKGIAVRLDERSWLRIMVDGTNRMEGVFEAGTERVFRGKNASVRAGNAGGVEISVNGRSVGKLGASGDVVDRSFTLAQ